MQLTKNASFVSKVCSNFISSPDGSISEYEMILQTIIDNYSNNIDADFFITDSSGKIIMTNNVIPDDTRDRVTINPDGPVDSIGENIINSVISDGKYEEKGNLGGLYKGDYFSVGMPIIPSDASYASGAVFAAKSAAPFNAYRTESIEIFLLAALLALGVTFFVVGFFAYSLVRPLRNMSAAVKSFGQGDFSVRVPVTSQDEIGQLAVAFNDMASSLANSESMRRSFTANVSHELRTPMTTISGFIDGILDGTIPDSERDKYLKIVSGETKRLSRLVKSMLDLSRIDSGDMRINPKDFNISNTIVIILLTFERSIEEKQVEIRGLDSLGNVTVYGDQDLIHQVIYNLVENAVKFTNPGGYIEFSVIDGIDRTSVAIKNSGAGIGAEDLTQVFDRFYKTDKSRSQDKKGMGLGLFIVKTIVLLHGGEISVSSVVNDYCRFEFYIPKRKQENPKKKDAEQKKEAKKDDGQRIIYDAEIVEEINQELDDKKKE